MLHFLSKRLKLSVILQTDEAICHLFEGGSTWLCTLHAMCYVIKHNLYIYKHTYTVSLLFHVNVIDASSHRCITQLAVEAFTKQHTEADVRETFKV